ncbi:MAG TPA: ribonuclease III [Terracidiphilus sp.]|nr:ribonuclease III [Terracidiphilus sp.]
MEAILAELETELGHAFRTRELLVRALTHRSLAQERVDQKPPHETGTESAGEAGNGAWNGAGGDNERLEFLGDAVLGLVVAEALFELHRDWHEGELTRVRAQLVSRQHMGKVAEAIGLGRHLRLSRGEDKAGLRRKSTVLSNSMEAVIGALFLDGGLEPVRVFAHSKVMGEAAEQLAEELRSGAALGNYKSALQERLQGERAGTPVYRVKSESGPDHRKRFLVEVRLMVEAGQPGKPLARGTGSTKKHAEQDAARRALERLTAMAAKAGGPEDAGLGGNGMGGNVEEQAGE